MEITEVILVDRNDQPLGSMEKIEAHQRGLLHRAFSVFIFNSEGQMLLQQRAPGKYHSPGLWTNACCSHPLPGEETLQAAKRRLKEELRFETPVTKIFDFIYRASFDNGLTEHEYDHVFTGQYDGAIDFDPEEVTKISYKNMDELDEMLRNQPEQYTTWFHIAFPRIRVWWNENYGKSHNQSV